MRRATRLRVAAASLAAFATMAGGTAVAYFSATGHGTAPAGVTSLPTPAIGAATPAVGGIVTLTWGAVAPPTEGAVTYYVTRDGEEAAGTCPGEAAPTSVTTCVDKGLEPGTHTYVVTAVWRSWTSESFPATPKVTVGALAKLEVSAASATPTAGVADNLTIAAQDSAGNTVTTYTGSHGLTFSGASASPGGTAPTVSNSSGTATPFGSATAISFSNGVANVTSTRNGVMKLYRAGATEIAVTDGTLSSAPLALSVSSATISKLILGVESNAPQVGSADDLTVTAQDTYANVVSTYSGTHNLTFSGASAAPNGTAPTVADEDGEATPFGTATALQFDEGVASVEGSANGEMRLYKSASASIKVAEGSISSAAAVVVATAGPAIRLNLGASTVTPTAGAADSLTTTAQDAYANTVTSYAGLHELTFEGASPSPGGTAPTVSNSSGTATPFGSATAINFTNGVASVSSGRNGSMRVYRAEPATITVSDGELSNGAGLAVNVATAATNKLILAAESSAVPAGGEDDLTITAQDTYANVITSYTGSHNLTFSGASASPGGNAPTVTNSAGTPVAFGTATAIEFNAGVATEAEGENGEMRLYKSATTNVKVSDGSVSSANVAVVVSPLAASKFVLGGSALTLTAGGSSNLTTTAQDPYGNTATSYAGAHLLTFEGASASPGGTPPTVVNSTGSAIPFGEATAINFTNGVAATGSSKNGLMRLYNAEPTTVVVSDGTVSNGTGLAFGVSAAAANKFVFNNLTVSRGSISATCLATCTVTGLGNSGTIKAYVAVADTYGNTVSNLGTGHTATVTTSGGSISGGSLSIPSTGAAESTSRFTFTAQSSGSFTDTIKAAASAGTVYTNATITASR